MVDEYETVLTVEVRPCLLGFDVHTYNVRVYAGGFSQGQGFKVSRGIFSAHDLFMHLIWTAEPFRVVVR